MAKFIIKPTNTELLLMDLAVMVNDLYSFAARDREDFDFDAQYKKHQKLMKKAMKLLLRFDEWQG